MAADFLHPEDFLRKINPPRPRPGRRGLSWPVPTHHHGPPTLLSRFPEPSTEVAWTRWPRPPRSLFAGPRAVTVETDPRALHTSPGREDRGLRRVEARQRGPARADEPRETLGSKQLRGAGVSAGLHGDPERPYPPSPTTSDEEGTREVTHNSLRNVTTKHLQKGKTGGHCASMKDPNTHRAGEVSAASPAPHPGGGRAPFSFTRSQTREGTPWRAGPGVQRPGGEPTRSSGACGTRARVSTSPPGSRLPAEGFRAPPVPSPSGNSE